jgi:SAM-dependent methyltransferase
VPAPQLRRAAATEWWASYFDAHYLVEHEPMFGERTTRREVGRLIEALGAPVGARVLDVPCGQGRHAALLAEAGYRVDGVDYSPYLVGRARAAIPPQSRRSVRFHRGDMRALSSAWTGRFEAVINVGTSFGFFRHPADDARALGEFARVLAPGGTLVWQGANRDGVMARFLSRDWWPTSDGALVGHQRRFDPLSGVLTVQTEWRGPAGTGERAYHLRLYTATRLAELLADVGLIVEQAFSGWTDRPLTRRAGEMLLVARKNV